MNASHMSRPPHADVEEDNFGTELGELVQSLGSVVSDANVGAQRLQQHRKAVGDIASIVNNRHAA
jgi:hypothetical protein